MTEKQMLLFQLRLKELRRASKLTQDDMAEYFYMTRSCWSNYERGIREPSLEMIQKIAKFFDIDIRYLIDGESLDGDVEEFIKHKRDVREYISKDGQLNLSALSAFDKILIVDFYRFLRRKYEETKSD